MEAWSCTFRRLARSFASVLFLLAAAESAHAGTYQGTALIEGAATVGQVVTSFNPNTVLPKDSSRTGTLAPGNYAMTFELIVAGNASDDPSDDQSIDRRDNEFQVLTGNFSLALSGGAYSVTSQFHVVTSYTNDIFGSPNADEVADSIFPDFQGSISGQGASIGQRGYADASLSCGVDETGGGFYGSGGARMIASNFSKLPSNANGGSNYSRGRAISRWYFTVTEDVSYTLTSRFDGTGTSGLTQNSAALPNMYLASTGASTFFDAVSQNWFAPTLAGSILFETTDGSLFTSILAFPEDLDGDDLFAVEAGGSNLGTFAVGEQVDFGAGVSSFIVSGIALDIGAVDPYLFPLKLEFDMPTAEFQTTAAPEPSGSVLGLAALCALALLRRARA